MPLDPITGGEELTQKVLDFILAIRKDMNQANKDRLDTILVENAEFWHNLFAPLRAKVAPPATVIPPPK